MCAVGHGSTRTRPPFHCQYPAFVCCKCPGQAQERERGEKRVSACRQEARQPAGKSTWLESDITNAHLCQGMPLQGTARNQPVNHHWYLSAQNRLMGGLGVSKLFCYRTQVVLWPLEKVPRLPRTYSPSFDSNNSYCYWLLECQPHSRHSRRYLIDLH